MCVRGLRNRASFNLQEIYLHLQYDIMESTKTIPKCSVCKLNQVVVTTQKRDRSHEAYLVRSAIDLIKKRIYFDF